MMKKNFMNARPPLLIALSLVSLAGFVAIIFNELGWYDISPLLSHLLFIILGIGLMFEGNVVKFIKALSTRSVKFQDISTKVITVIVGIFSVIVGVLSLLRVDSEMLNSLRLLVAVIAFVVIVIETWFVK